MNASNALFEKLLDYEQRAHRFDSGSGRDDKRQGEFAGVIFRIGNDRLTCNIERVHEFLPLPAFTRVPGAKPWILGLANIRGDLVTIIDLAWFLKGERSAITMRSRLLAASLRGRPVGLLVDEVFGQRNFMESDASSPRLPAESPLHHFVSRQFRSGQETWQELDLNVMFNMASFLNGAAD